jgi:hypothetical protein
MTELFALPNSAERFRRKMRGTHFLLGMRRGPGATLAAAVAAAMCLSSCSSEGLVEAQHKAREASVRANMRTVQIAAESYASDHGGKYPTEVDENFKSYFPGGSYGGSAATAGKPPINPYDYQKEWPVIGHVTDVAASRHDPSATLEKGTIEYSPIGGPPATTYAIRGGGGDGKVIGAHDPSMALVLSNQ